MQFNINIEKKHIYFLAILITLATVSLVIAQVGGGVVSHSVSEITGLPDLSVLSDGIVSWTEVANKPADLGGVSNWTELVATGTVPAGFADGDDAGADGYMCGGFCSSPTTMQDLLMRGELTFGNVIADSPYLWNNGGKLYFESSWAGSKFIFMRGLVAKSLGTGGQTNLCIDMSTDVERGLLSSCSSSIRYKEHVKDLSLGLGTVSKLRPVVFDWKNSQETDIGFIAEEVEQIDPILATYTDGTVEGVKYRQLTAVLVNAIQEQQAQIDELKVQIAKLK